MSRDNALQRIINDLVITGNAHEHVCASDWSFCCPAMMMVKTLQL